MGHKHKHDGKKNNSSNDNPPTAIVAGGDVRSNEEASVSKHTPNSNNAVKEPRRNFLQWKDVKWTDVAIAIFTGVLTFVAVVQYAVAKDQLRQSQLSERAYISVEPFMVKNLETDTPVIIMSLNNRGHMPALKVRHGVQGGVCPYPIPKDAPIQDEEMNQADGFIANGSINNKFLVRPHLVDGDRELINSGQRKLCAWGIVEYSTIEETHHTRFCFVVGGLIGEAIENCGVYADAD